MGLPLAFTLPGTPSPPRSAAVCRRCARCAAEQILNHDAKSSRCLAESESQLGKKALQLEMTATASRPAHLPAEPGAGCCRRACQPAQEGSGQDPGQGEGYSCQDACQGEGDPREEGELRCARPHASGASASRTIHRAHRPWDQHFANFASTKIHSRRRPAARRRARSSRRAPPARPPRPKLLRGSVMWFTGPAR